jgi:hypothetical protein
MKGNHAALAVLVCGVLLAIISVLGYPSKDTPKIQWAEKLFNVWKTAIDGYYKDIKYSKDISMVDDIRKRSDKGAKELGVEDWVDLCIKVATSDPDGYKKVVEEISKYLQKQEEEYAVRMTDCNSAKETFN